MITIHNEDQMIPAQVEAVKRDMAKRNIKYYYITLGNNCLWVYYSLPYSIDLYYCFDKNNNIIDIQVD